MQTVVSQTSPPKKSFLYDPKVRGVFYQVVLVAAIVSLFYMAATNAIENLQRAKIASGFGFLNNTAGFDISQTLIAFSAAGSNLWRCLHRRPAQHPARLGDRHRASRRSSASSSASRACPRTGWWRRWRWSMSRLLRNIPLLLQLLFWYIAVLGPLPQPRDSLEMGAGFFLNSRGLFMPRPLCGRRCLDHRHRSRHRPRRHVRCFAAGPRSSRSRPAGNIPSAWSRLRLVFGLPILTWIVLALVGANPITFDMPRRARSTCAAACRSCRNSWRCCSASSPTRRPSSPRWSARASSRSRKGRRRPQARSASRPGQTLRLVVIPQAMRVIIPPLTSQYLNLTKNSSLAVAIGYPDLVQVFMGTVLNQTGQAIEVVVITMGVYLTISLVTSFVMNIYNRRVAIVER